MSTVSMQISKETFVPEKNYFKCETVTVTRKETREEIELWNRTVTWSNRGFVSIALGLLLAITCFITFGCLISAFQHPLYYFGAGFGAVSFITGFALAYGVFWPRENECSEIYRQWKDEHEKELWAEATKEIQEYNDEQRKIADAWRAEHPLEEMIRACIKDPKSSVDVANLVRYYAEEYIKEI